MDFLATLQKNLKFATNPDDEEKKKKLSPGQQVFSGLSEPSPFLSTLTKNLPKVPTLSTAKLTDKKPTSPTLQKASRFAYDAVVGYPVRAAIQVALSLAPKKVKENIGSINPDEDFGNFIGGLIPSGLNNQREITPFQKETPELASSLEGAYGKAAMPIAFGATIGSSLLDLIPFGTATKRGAVKLAEAGIEEAPKLFKKFFPKLEKELIQYPNLYEDVIENLGKNKDMQVSENIIKKVSEQLKNTETAKVADRVTELSRKAVENPLTPSEVDELSGLLNIGTKADEVVEQGFPTVQNRTSGEQFAIVKEGDDTSLIKSLKTNEELTVRNADLEAKFTRAIDDTGEQISKELQPLVDEARKFKNADEFINSKDIDNNLLKVYDELYANKSSGLKAITEGEGVGGSIARRAPGDISTVGGSNLKGIVKFINENPKGFTLSLNGEPVTKGFVVSPYKGRETIVDVVDAKSMESFLSKNMDLLKLEGNYFGGWKNPKDGKFYLDVSIVKDNLDEAFHVAGKNNQIGIYDIKGDKTVYTADILKSQLKDLWSKGQVPTPLKMGDTGPVTVEKAKEYSKLRQGLANVWTKVVEKIQNNINRIEKVVKNPDAVVTESSNPVLSRILYSGRLQAKIETTQKQVTKVVEDMVEKAKTSHIPYQKLKDDVNDYMHALHTPERNAVLGDGAAGMTDQQALEIMEKLKLKPYYEEIKKAADELLDINKQTLDILYAEGRSEGVIEKKLYDTLRERYKNHVPLNRVFDEQSDIGQILTSRGFDVRGPGLRKAKGSAREVDDIMGNITTNLMSAQQRVEKNIVDNATYDFVKANPDLDIGKIITNPGSLSDPLLLSLKRNGKDAYVKFNDLALAGQFKGVGDESLPPMLNFIGAFTRLYSSLSTRFNPEFFLSNKFRDIQESMIYASSETKLGAKGAAGVLGKEARLQNEKAILDFMAGKDTKGAQLYKEMIDEGGTTGGLALSTKKDIKADIKHIEKLAQSKPRQALEGIVNSIDKLNEIFENSTRLSVYRQAKEMGLSNKEAARMAKESTVNFNRKGQWGSVINSLYMFSNASIQGSAKMLKAMKNPKVLGGVMAITGSTVFATNKFNDSQDPQWRDKINKFDRTSNLVVVLQGGNENEFKYITIPVSYAIKPIKVAFDGAYDLMTGHEKATVPNVLEKTVAAIADSYNPVGGTSLGSALTPTIADIPAEIGLNKKWTGSKIRPDADPDLPDSRSYFDSLKDTAVGRFSVDMTKKLSDNNIAEISPANMAYAITQYSGGAGKFISKTINTISDAVGDEPVKLDEVPFVSRFYKKIEGDELDSIQANSSSDSKLIKEIRGEGSKQNFDSRQEIKNLIKDIQSMKTPEEKERALAGMDAETLKKFTEEIQKQSKDFNQKQYESLQISNGERARFIMQKVKSLNTVEEKTALIDDLVTRGILTKDVIQQLAILGQSPN